MSSPTSGSGVPNPTPPSGPTQPPAAGSSPLGQNFDTTLISSAAQTIGNFLGDGINALVQPPVLRTFVYSPQVRVVIDHLGVQYDISSDVVRCTLIRPENSAASFFCTLQNKGLRYTPLEKPRFSRMDRIVVYMKKTSWLQVFSGYLDSVPYRQLYDGTVNIKATCTLKRLMHTWFNPDLPESNDLLSQLNSPDVSLGGDGQGSTDSGLGSLLRRVLVTIGGWNQADIHIQSFPTNFFNFLSAQLQTNNAANQANVLKFKQMLLGSDTSPGPGAYAGHDPNAGTAGPATPGVGGVSGASAGAADALTMFYVGQIVAACDEKGLGPIVSDNNVGAGLTQAGTTGASGGGITSPSDQKAWQQVQQTGLDLQQNNRNSDGAILGVAASMVETGGGTGIRNLSNPAMPGSDQFPNDGPGFNGTSVGIMQQQNYAEWGDLSQRMNPKQAAGMFFAHLNVISGWRSLDPGAAIQQVQRSATPTAYSAAVPLATKIVQGYRTSQAGTASTAAAGVVPGVSVPAAGSAPSAAPAGLGGAPSSTSNSVVGAASTSPSSVVTTGGVAPARAGKPSPDSEGAINWAMTQLGKPYIWGGHGPAGYDCSGLVSAAFKSIGIYVPAQTNAIRSSVPQIPNNSVQRGDLVEPTDGHVVLWCGDGTIIEAQQTGVPIHRIASWIGAPSSWAWVGRACQNGGPDPSAPFNPPATMGPGNPPGALDQTGGTTSTGSGGSSEPATHNLFSYLFTGQFTSDIAEMFTGEKAFIEGQPLLQMAQAIASAGLRSWSSGPDGSFMAWYPDYWGLDGKPAVLRLEDIELKDVHIDFSDDPLATHVYINGDIQQGLGQFDEVAGWLDTAGVATVENAWLYQRLVKVAPSDDMDGLTGDLLMRRYGIRPLKETFALAGTHELEFLLATKVFMEQWAKQYETEISMTFMPELFPGMRVDLAGKNLQVYVTSVTHTCDYEQGFSTTATIMAPSVPNAKALMAAVSTPTGPTGDSTRAFTDPLSRGAGG